METHVRVIGILHVVFGVMGVAGALLLLLVFGGAAEILRTTADPEPHHLVPILGAVGGILSCVVVLVSLPGIIGGFGLLRFRGWGRILMLVVSALDLLNVPFGTALGVYGLWVLLHAETIRLFQDPARTRSRERATAT